MPFESKHSNPKMSNIPKVLVDIDKIYIFSYNGEQQSFLCLFKARYKNIFNTQSFAIQTSGQDLV